MSRTQNKSETVINRGGKYANKSCLNLSESERDDGLKLASFGG